VKWEYDRDDLSGGSYSILFTDPLIILLGIDESSARLVALNPESGRKVWDEKVDTPYGLAGFADQNRLMLAFRDGSNFKSRMIDLATGDAVYETDLPSDAFSDATHIPIFAEEATARLVGSSIIEVDLADGSIVGTLDIPIASPASTVFLTDAILTWDTMDIACIDRASNEVRWINSPDNTPIQTVAVNNGQIVLVTGTGPSTMSMLDPLTGLPGCSSGHTRLTVRSSVLLHPAGTCSFIPLIQQRSGCQPLMEEPLLSRSFHPICQLEALRLQRSWDCLMYFK